MQIRLMNFAGLDEAGIDGGGIFREFMSELIKTSFDPNRGFFCCTADKLLYPNPQARLLVDNFTSHYYFLGRVLGKVSCSRHSSSNSTNTLSCIALPAAIDAFHLTPKNNTTAELH